MCEMWTKLIVSMGGALDGSHAKAGMSMATPTCISNEASELPAIGLDWAQPVMKLLQTSLRYSNAQPLPRVTALGVA